MKVDCFYPLQIKQYLLKEHNTRFDRNYQSIMIAIGISTFLNPEYKNLIKQKDDNLYAQTIKCIYNELKYLVSCENETAISLENELNKSMKKLKIEEIQYSENLLADYQNITDNDEDEDQELGQDEIIKNEIKLYNSIKIQKENLQNSLNVLQFYQKHQLQLLYLTQIAKKYHCIPGSSAEQERQMILTETQYLHFYIQKLESSVQSETLLISKGISQTLIL